MATANSITAKAGRLFLLKISDGTSPTTYVTVAGLRATGISINSNPVDATSKSSNGWREMLEGAGVEQVSFTASGVMDASNDQIIALQNACLTPARVECEIISGKGDKLMGTFLVSQFQRDGTHNDVETFSLTLESTGPVVYSAT